MSTGYTWGPIDPDTLRNRQWDVIRAIGASGIEPAADPDEVTIKRRRGDNYGLYEVHWTDHEGRDCSFTTMPQSTLEEAISGVIRTTILRAF